jgi:endonuclease/exonuclease/phosphatase family metal-dependent hydrolase
MTGGANSWTPKVQQGQLQEAADALKKLNPDVIVLQQVTDWKTCTALAQALEPEKYQVVICSGFRDARTKKLGRQQVAILSRSKAYISWTEAWQTNGATEALPGGFAFAAIHIGDKNAGIFSLQLSDDSAADSRSTEQQAARERSVRQLIRKLTALQNWTTNRLDTLVVAGDFNTTPDDEQLAYEKTLPLLTGFGFENALANLPLEQRVTLPGSGGQPDATVDYIFTRGAGRVTTPQIVQTALSAHCAVTCDLELGAVPVARAPVPVAKVAVPETNKVAAAPVVVSAPIVTNAPVIAPPLAVVKTEPGVRPQMIWSVVGFLAGCAVLLVVMRWRSHRSRGQLALPNTPPFVHIAIDTGTQTQSQTQLFPLPLRGQPLPEAVRAGVAAQLTRWFKQKFVQRLVADRAELLATQETAALKMLAVDERLAKIERRIEQRNREYEQRIDDLLKELANAHEENRELIRAKIALVKAEMEKERVKAEQYVKESRHN